MNYQEFLEKITQGVTAFMGEGTEVAVSAIMKNNAVRLDGLSILEKNRNISPTIYLNGYYEEYRRGRDLGSIVYDIVAVYEKGRLSENVNVNFFTDYEKARERLVYKLVSYDKNRELLAQIPHRRYLDLAVVYYCLVMNDCLGNATILVYNSHMEMWGVDADELHRQAERNTRRLLGFECKSMEEIMRELMAEEIEKERRMKGEPLPGRDEEEQMIGEMLSAMGEPGGNAPMYVLSNRNRTNGAACILYPNLLEEFSEQLGYDLFILPSSIHEVIAIPALEGENPEFLESMVREVNETQVVAEEVLSDRIYYYDRRKKELFIL